MAIPKTYLMVPPPGETNPFGRGIDAQIICTRLMKINPRIRTGSVVPIKGSVISAHDTGATCLWLETFAGLKKICAIRLGTVPEFTQTSPDGEEIARGWRAVFERVIRARAATREQLERAFGVSLVLTEQTVLCRACLRQGQRKPSNGGVKQLCGRHERIITATSEERKAQEYVGLSV